VARRNEVDRPARSGIAAGLSTFLPVAVPFRRAFRGRGKVSWVGVMEWGSAARPA